MEFGIFVQGYTPQFRQDKDPEAEHHALMNELELVQAADRAGFKYVWATEHHFLDEYSHLSANEVFLGYLASCTERIHLGSGIFNPLPQVNHPAKVAEKVAMLDHLSGGRVEFGTGRGAGSHEILGFLPDMKDLVGHPRDLGRRDPRVPEDVDAGHLRGLRGQVLVAAAAQDPAEAVREATPADVVRRRQHVELRDGRALRTRRARLLRRLASTSSRPCSRRTRTTSSTPSPIGAYVNDNVMVTSAAFVAEDREAAVQSMVAGRLSYLQSNVFRYHDTFPHPDWAPKWPELLPDPTVEEVRASIGTPGNVVGNPDDALKACQEWADAGVDQISFGQGMATQEEALETIRLIGEHVIPKLDTDPEHRTSRFRREAGANA